MNSSKAIFWYVALLLDEWFCSFWTLCWSNSDLIETMHAWQRPCFQKEGSQIHSCIKPTESKSARREARLLARDDGQGLAPARPTKLVQPPSFPPPTHCLRCKIASITVFICNGMLCAPPFPHSPVLDILFMRLSMTLQKWLQNPSHLNFFLHGSC